MINEKQNIKDVSNAWKISGGLGFADTIFNHISSTSSYRNKNLQMTMNPYGFLASEVTEKNVSVFPLKKYSPSDATQLKVNSDGLQLHTALHLTQMKAGVTIHTHSHIAIAVSCYKDGLLPLSQTAIEFVCDIEIIKHDGVFRSNALTLQLIRFAKKGGVALLQYHGAFVVVDNIEAALYLKYYIEESCKLQLLTLSQGEGEFTNPNKSAIRAAQKALRIDRVIVAKELYEAFKQQL